MARSSARSFGGACLWLLCLLLGSLDLAACGEVSTASPVAVPSLGVLPPLHARAESVVSAPCGALWPEGENITLHGLYRTSGHQAYLDVLRFQVGEPPCWARFFLDRDLGLGVVSWETPFYLEVTGQASAERWSSPGLWDLRVVHGSKLALDLMATASACRQAIAAQAGALGDLDWSALATPAYVTGTLGFHPSSEQLAQARIQVMATDDRQPLLVLTAQGPDLPAVRPLVRRWVSLECVYDLQQMQVAELIATIRGEVQE